MARFRNDTGSVLASAEFGLIPPGEFEVHGYDPEVHGVIPGCTWLDAPAPAPAPEPEGDAGTPDGDTATPKTTGKRKAAEAAKENPA